MAHPVMSPKRRFLTALLGGQPDRIPVGNVVSIATMELMEKSGGWFPQVHLEVKPMVKLAEAGHTVLGYDTVMPVFSVVQEAAALGCEVNWSDPEMMPAATTHLFAKSRDMHLSKEWMDSPAIQVVLEAVCELRRDLGHEVVIVGKVMGPWTLSYHMLGIEEFLISTLRDPNRAHRSLHILKDVTIKFAIAQIKAGADIICLADHATGGMISPKSYRDFLLPVHQEIISQLGCPTVLHCCGKTTDRLQYFTQAGFDCYHFESQVRLEDALAATRGKMTLMGNINNPETLLTGTVDQVAEACRKVVRSGVQILSPECAVPLHTPLENLRALVKVAEEEKQRFQII